MKRLLCTVLLLFLFAIPGFAAMENEFPGFRGIRWNDKPSKFKDELYEARDRDYVEQRKKHESTEYAIYERKNEKLYLGLAKLEAVYYYFDKFGLARVDIHCKSSEDSSELISACIKNWGTDYEMRTLQKNNIVDGYSYTWQGKETMANITRFFGYPAGLMLSVGYISDRDKAIQMGLEQAPFKDDF